MLAGQTFAPCKGRTHWLANNNKTSNAISVNTDICVDIKTKLRSSRMMTAGRCYRGSLRKDLASELGALSASGHYTFTEAAQQPVKRYPHIYQGTVITMTRREDGSVQPHFRPLPRGSRFSCKAYAWLVRDELMEAFKVAEAERKAQEDGSEEEAAPYLW